MYLFKKNVKKYFQGEKRMLSAYKALEKEKIVLAVDEFASMKFLTNPKLPLVTDDE